MKVLAFSGSPRRNGNTAVMLETFLSPFREAGYEPEIIVTDRTDIRPCRGCLRCNLLKRCVIRGDQWPELSRKILEADILVFATPVYFHHATASLKKILDRFRSFMKVRITEEGLVHTPWDEWKKELVLLTAMGSPSQEEARPLIELFHFICETLGPENRLRDFHGTRLAVAGQVCFEESQLLELYPKLELPLYLAGEDAARNRLLLKDIEILGRKMCLPN